MMMFHSATMFLYTKLKVWLHCEKSAGLWEPQLLIILLLAGRFLPVFLTLLRPSLVSNSRSSVSISYVYWVKGLTLVDNHCCKYCFSF